ncbi:MAG: DUF3078 domain-containing protein [Dysgonamonadaceae bacterium]|jgi:hypothetical protein|nr:DUF3078 domain-containing protein [Dysgonamonadaceae bacterium]
MNKFIFITAIFSLLATAGIKAQTTKSTVDNLASHAVTDTTQGWKHSGLANITFGQTALKDWVAGGDNQLSANFLLNASANYLRNKWFWDNGLVMEYGMIQSSSLGVQKASDRFNLNSVGGYKFSDKWAVAGLVNFATQFANGYDYSQPEPRDYISKMMAPAYLDIALGLTWKPSSALSVFMSPLAERGTFVCDKRLSDAEAFGVDPGKRSKFETGAYLMANFNKNVTKDFSVIATLYMFTPYSEDFGNVDTNLNVLLNYKLSKYFTATLNTTLRYYESELTEIQLKEIFGIGLTYSF